MYQQLTNRVGVFGGGVNVGVIMATDGKAILVDTGANEGNARKLLRHLRNELRLTVTTVLTTHAHADHFGGHEFVVKRTECSVRASRIEATMIEHPELQPTLLYGGASPPAALRERFILARPVPVDVIVTSGRLLVDGVAIEVVPLPGHSPNQVGYLVDGVFFCADVVFPASAIAKFRIPYLYDLERHLVSMETASMVDCDWVVPGHGDVEHDIRPLLDRNLAIAEETIDVILHHLPEPTPLEPLAKALFAAMDVPIPDHLSYYLLRPTIAAYLTVLERRGEIEHVTVDRQSCWKRT